MSVLLSPHFSLRELTVTEQIDPATGRLFVNKPDELATLYLWVLANTMLEQIRDLWACPLLVTSGYRSPQVEMAVSGKMRGQHMLGQAADIRPADGKLSLDEAYHRIYEAGLPYDQLLLEAKANGSRWIHVSIAPVLAEPREDAFVTTDGGENWALYEPPKKTEEGSTT